MKFKNFIEKFTVSFIGIITFFLLLEIFLRIIGNISSRRFDNQPAGNSYNASYIILCLGDSFTFGAGAPLGMDYPSQLEAMLNSRAGNKKFKVINRGISSYNTTQMLNELKDALRKGIKPNLVILLGGQANYWNYWGYHVYLKGKTPSSIINDYLYRVRIYKLVRLLFLNIKDKIKVKLFTRKINDYSLPDAATDNSQENNSESIDKQKAAEDPNKHINYCAKGRFYNKQRQYDEAIKWFKNGIEINPNNSDCYLGIGWNYIFRYQYDEAIKWFKNGIEINPNNSDCYAGMAFSYSSKKDFEKALVYIKKAIKLNPGAIRYYSILFRIYRRLGRYEGGLYFLNELSEDNLLPECFVNMLKKMNNKEDIVKEVKQWVISHIENIIKICKDNKIKILLHDYPYDPIITDLFYNITKDKSVPFVSNYQIFRKLSEAGERMEDYLTPDRHCNAKGYAIMARNIFDKIIQEKVFDFD